MGLVHFPEHALIFLNLLLWFVVDIISKFVQTRQAFTAEEINEGCYVDIIGNKAVFDSLKNNHKVSYDGKHFSYKVTTFHMHIHVDYQMILKPGAWKRPS